MPSYTAPKKRQPPRVLLLLVGVFVVIGVVVIATHKNPTSNANDDKPTPTTVVTKLPVARTKTPTTGGARPSTTAASGKSPISGGKTTTTLSAKPPERTGNPITSVPRLQSARVLFDIQGSGDDTIGQFVIRAASTPWDVNWSYSCSKLGKKAGFNYSIVFIQGARPDLNDLGPGQTATSGSGVERYEDAGTFGMIVATQCSWTVEISKTNP